MAAASFPQWVRGPQTGGELWWVVKGQLSVGEGIEADSGAPDALRQQECVVLARELSAPPPAADVYSPAAFA
jgi:hypothetical protein